MMNTVSSSSVAVSRGRRLEKRMMPSGERLAPITITSPSTSSALARIEPTIAVWATTSCPFCSAKITTNSSGRLPSVDCSMPGHARPEALAELLGGERDDPREARERDGREQRTAGTAGQPP